MSEMFDAGEVSDAFTEPIAQAEQEAHRPEERCQVYLYDTLERERLLLAALRFRMAAVTIEALSLETVPALKSAALRGIARYLEEGQRFYGEVVAEG